MPTSVVGTWRLVVIQNKKSDGQVYLPYGEDVDGYITYTDEGRVSVVWRAGDRTSPTGVFSAYAGTYEIDGDRIIHHVTIASDARREGTDLVRALRFDGKRISLTPVEIPPWMSTGGVGEITTLVWERVS